ncbi:uncharacterized protein LOC129776575 [Toxorhynchites rutilus septentrionalis]|uniref:uncharacterized protein LOC129776575 n=1 Tax=Toxorhynchites rutilus septentrionalis TaxID=329112 RepID=UPI0024794F5C|nr:uncharacterized protein LOC129776575 [Toxorhynchites rutilus septentrionalis]
MGMRTLDMFLRKSVPNGFFEINIEEEIRKYYDNATKPNPPAPIIVIDLMVMGHAICQADYNGQICGGRLKVAYMLLDQLFTKLRECGAVLEFFCDGPVQVNKYGKWCERQNRSYRGMLDFYDEVDYGCTTAELIETEIVLIVHGGYPLKQLAQKHGRLTTSFGIECVQESAAYATDNKALAILSNDTDYLIYAGTWHLWSSMNINFDTLTTLEYNRQGLMDTLDLSYSQMPLFALLSGDNVLDFEMLQKFYDKLGNPSNRFHDLAEFVRQHPEDLQRSKQLRLLLRGIVGRAAVNSDLVKRFQQGLNFYDTNFHPPNLNPNGDHVLDVLLKQNSTFLYAVWVGKPKELATTFVDLQPHHFGIYYPRMIISIMSRQAGIILYHRQKRRIDSDFTRFNLLTKLSHNADHSLQQHRVEFPEHIEPPSLVDLLSTDPEKRAQLQEIKLQLFCWIASDTLNHRLLKPIPEELRIMVVTLYCLMENRLLKLFEADHLLQIAYDVTYETYDHTKINLPRTFHSRGYRVAFLFISVFNVFMEAYKDLGLASETLNEYPPFDGMLFHNHYENWSVQKQNLNQIREWRIYDRLVPH